MATYQGQELDGYVDPFPGLRNTDRVEIKCGVCDGTGKMAVTNPRTGRAYKRRFVCFMCSGAGKFVRTVQSQRRLAMHNAARRKSTAA
jgi:hypothetical protein